MSVCYEGSGCVSGDIAGESLCSTFVTGDLMTLLLAGGRACEGAVTPPFAFAFACERSDGGGVVSPSSSGIGGQYVFSTCFSAGRRIGLDKKKFMPESRHSLTFCSSAYCGTVSHGCRVQMCITYSCQSYNRGVKPRLSYQSSGL